MFAVEVNNKVVKFTFRHTRDCYFKIKPNKIVTDVTSCRMEIGDQQFDTLAACLQGDQFNKEKGRKIALKRAMDEAKLDRSERTAIWDAYFNRAERSAFYVTKEER